MSIFRYIVPAFVSCAFLAACSGGGSSPSQPAATATPMPSATPTLTPTPSPTPSATPPVTVNVSGSTNTQPYQIVLQQNATAMVTRDYGASGASTQSTTVSATDAAKFFTDLNNFTPISNINPGTCQKSASYGTTTAATYKTFTTGDLSCAPADGPADGVTLYDDEQKIEKDITANIGSI